MASFGTGIVRESVFVAELEKEFQSRLMTLSCSQHSLNADSVEKWLQTLGMADYVGLFMSNGFDDVNFLVSRKRGFGAVLNAKCCCCGRFNSCILLF